MNKKINARLRKFSDEQPILFDCTALTAIFLVLLKVLWRSGTIFGSHIDWASQHYVFPDYFRKLFYETGQLFPSFAPNIGSGENIYHFSYYGFLSPITLSSYLFPFIPMYRYISIASIVSAWLSVELFYIFMHGKFRRTTAFLSALMLMFSPPLMFHSHRHIMFVCYLPYLILAFMSTDLFLKRGLRSPLIICTAFIIFSNYFFSVPCIFAIAIYFCYSYLEMHRTFRSKQFIAEFLGWCGCILISVMISAILLLPTFMSIFDGREKTNGSLSITALLPFSAIDVVTVSPYAMGMPLFGMLAIISAILSKWHPHRRFLGIVLAAAVVFPEFVLALNLGMYANGKVLIPFIPLLLILIAQQYDELADSAPKMKMRIFLLGVTVVLTLVAYTPEYDFMMNGSVYLFGIDLLISGGLLIAYLLTHKKVLLILTMSLTTVIFCIGSSFVDRLIPTELIRMEQNIVTEEMLEIIGSDENIVRSSSAIRKSDTPNLVYGAEYYSPYIYSSLHNKRYNDFYFNYMQNENEYRNSSLTACSSNILFNSFIGCKYLVASRDFSETGYTNVHERGERCLFRNEYAMPIGRSSDMLMSSHELERLNEAETAEALMKCIVIDDDRIPSSYSSSCTEYDGITMPNDEHIVRRDGRFIITSDTEFTASFELPEAIPEDRLLMIVFDVENLTENKDARIRINSMKNTLTAPNWTYYNHNETFSYVLGARGEDELKRLDFTFSDGKYRVRNIRAWTLDQPKNHELTGEFIFDKAQTKGDVMVGNIDCERDGYFLLTVPYDRHFSIEVDSKPQEYEIADHAFIGFPISKGAHEISIKYTAPLRNEALIISISGVILLLLTAVLNDSKKMGK